MYTPTEKQIAQNQKAFTYVAPSAGQPERYERIRAFARELGHTFVTNCPESRELSLAMTKLEEALMWANASIARNEGA